MQYVFGKTITTAKGTYRAGEPLPGHWTGKETMRQLRATYGEDVLIEGKTAAETFTAYGEMLSAVLSALQRIEKVLSVETERQGNGGAARAKRPGRPRKPVEASPSA